MFGRFRRDRAPPLLAVAGEALEPATAEPCARAPRMRTDSAREMAAAVPPVPSPDEIAAAVLAAMRADPYDVFYTVTEVDEWIADYLEHRLAWDAVRVDTWRGYKHVRKALKAAPGVDYASVRFNVDKNYEFVRLRLARRAKGDRLPEKVWLFTIHDAPASSGTGPERTPSAQAGPPPRLVLEPVPALGGLEAEQRRTRAGLDPGPPNIRSRAPIKAA